MKRNRKDKDVVSKVRAAANAKSRLSRWGEPRAPMARICVDADVAEELATLPERIRRSVASDSVRKGVAAAKKTIERAESRLSSRPKRG